MSALRLEVVGGPAAGEQLEIDDETLIGRGQPGTRALGGDPELSRAHARLWRAEAGELIVEDLGSANGTFVNGKRIDLPAVLSEGDEVKLGASTLRVRSEAAPVSAAEGPRQVPADRMVRRGAAAGPAARGRAGRSPVALLGLLLLLAVAGLVTVLAAGGTSSGTAEPLFDGTVYVLSNRTNHDGNTVVALRSHGADLSPLWLREYSTGGSGSYGFREGAAVDGDQQVWTNPARTLLFAVNQGSDTVAVFRIAADGTLTAVPGSPFRSGGVAPESVGVSSDTLVVVNKALDYVRKLTAPSSITTLRIHGDGALTQFGRSFTYSSQGNPTQAWVDPTGNLVVVPVSSTGQFLTFTRSRSGAVSPGPVTQVGRAETRYAAQPSGGQGSGNSSGGARGHRRGPPSNVLGLLGVVGYPGKRLLYAEVASLGELLVYSYDLTGRLRFIKGLPIPNGLLSCWAEITPNGRFLYIGVTATDTISVFDLSTPADPRFVQSLKLRGGGGTFNLRVDPDGRTLFALSTRHSATDNGNLLHALQIGPGGRLTEPASSPVALPISSGTSAYGLVFVPRR